MATPAPLLSACFYNEQSISVGQALNTLASCWRFFTVNRGLRAGCPTQGVFETNPLWLDPYSGPASALWSTRSLVMYYFVSRNLDWNQVKIEPLPAQSGDVSICLQKAKMNVEIDRANETTTIQFHDNKAVFNKKMLKRSSLKDCLKSYVFGAPHRPSNNLLDYEIRTFDSSLRYYR